MTTLLPIALSFLLQSTILLLLGLLALHITRQRGPAVQSLVGRATLSGVALSALLTIMLAGHLHSLYTVSLPEPPIPQQTVAAPVTKNSVETPLAVPSPFDAPNPMTASHPPSKSVADGSGTADNASPTPESGERDEPGMASSAPTDTKLPTSAPPQRGGAALAPGWVAALGSLWPVVTVLLWLWLAICHWYLTRLRRTAIPIASGPAATLLAELISRPPRVLIHPSVHSPFLAGLVQPAIFLPPTYITEFPPDALRAILAHELAHLQRRDNAWTLASRLLCALLWPQPLLWLLCRRLEQIAEDACDEAVLAQHCPPRAYADCLLALTERWQPSRRERALGASVAPYRSSLGRRVQRILTQGKQIMLPVTTKLRLTIAALTLAAVLGGLCLVSSALAKPAEATAPVLAPPVLTPQELQYRVARKQDLQNLKIIGLAIGMYERDFDYRTPDANHWMDQIVPYLKQIRPYRASVFFDPFQPGKKRYGYAFNRLCSNKSLFVFSNPLETVIVYDSTLGKRNASDTGQSPSLRTIKRSSNNSFISISGTSYGFVDGHAKWFTRGIHPSFSLKGGEPTGAALSAPTKIRYFVKLPHSLAKSNIELSKAQFLAGLTAVQGPGVIVTLRDSKQPFPKALPLDMLPPNIIHDSDINQVVNELRSAGAEAVSVNDQRLVATSAVRTAGSTIYINNTLEAAPYTIKAIGNSTEILSVLKMPGGIASQVQQFDPAMFSVRASNLLELPAFTGGSSPRYAMPLSSVIPVPTPTAMLPSQTLQQKAMQTQFKLDVLNLQEGQLKAAIQKMRGQMQRDIKKKVKNMSAPPKLSSHLPKSTLNSNLEKQLAAAQTDLKVKEGTLAFQDPARIAAQKKVQMLQTKQQFVQQVHQYSHLWVALWNKAMDKEAVREKPPRTQLADLHMQKYLLIKTLRDLKRQLQHTPNNLPTY